MRAWWVVVMLSGCGDNFDAATSDAPAAIDARVPDTVDATVPVEATTFVMGAAPACSSSTATTNACLAQAAASAWGSCTPPAGYNPITTGEAPFPAVYISRDEVGGCTVMIFVETACGPAIVSWMMGAPETTWSGFGVAGGECWMTQFGRVCAALMPIGDHTIDIGYCSAGFYTCSGVSNGFATVTSSGAVVGFGGATSGCFPGGGCGCW
jgi:hypothetical protein